MADTKISALPASTVPLAGTEVLPIVQSGATKKVAIDDLTKGKYTPTDGIKFPASQVPSADANTLDDYEEGTWSPAVTASGGALTTVGTVSGSYTKIGRIVHAFFDVNITLNGTGDGSILIANIPAAPSAANTSMGVFREQAVNGKMGSVNLPDTFQLQLQFYDNSYPGSDGCRLVGQITYYV